MTPLEFIIVCLLCATHVLTTLVLDRLSKRFRAQQGRTKRLEQGLSDLADLVGKMVGERVDETLSESARRLNAFEGR